MKAKIIFDGREMEIDITENFSLELESCLPVEKKKTGYERVEQGEYYFLQTYNGKGVHGREDSTKYDDNLYASANYYSDKTIAENNAKADKLFRQLRRFAVEHREKELDWCDSTQKKFVIAFRYETVDFFVRAAFSQQLFGGIYFDSEEMAYLAIEMFHDELMWYFTEYKDSL